MLSNVTHSNFYFECNTERGSIYQLYIELGSHLNEKLQLAEESVDRLEIAVKQQMNSDQQSGSNVQAEDKYLIHNHLACAKTEVSKLRSANDQAAVEVKDNQKALDKMEEAKAERKLALKR